MKYKKQDLLDLAIDIEHADSVRLSIDDGRDSSWAYLTVKLKWMTIWALRQAAKKTKKPKAEHV